MDFNFVNSPNWKQFEEYLDKQIATKRLTLESAPDELTVRWLQGAIKELRALRKLKQDVQDNARS